MKLNYNCKFCDKIVYSYTGQNKGKYCSVECQQNYQWMIRKIIIEDSGCVPATPKAARRYLLDKFGNVCSICKLKEWFGKLIPLVCDHINGNSDDWTLNNLRMICPNCDAQTDTFKGKNLGNGRYYRRIRYAEGKSY